MITNHRIMHDKQVKIKGVSNCLGKGVSGTVWKVVDQSIKEVLALKEMEVQADDDKIKCVRLCKKHVQAPYTRIFTR